VRATPAPAGAQTGWTMTSGSGPVPAVSTAYGATTAARVRVEWIDGQIRDVTPLADGSWLTARPGQIPVQRIDLLDAAGRVTQTVVGR
jgi:hypothetical protein